MAPTKSARPSARDRILTAASELFYREGVQNVGIDRIIAKSGVAKMSLYNHFKSKDALIAAYLEQRHADWRKRFQEQVEALATDPRDRLLAIFDVLQTWFQEEGFRGCAFVNSSVELANFQHPGSQVSLRHRQSLADYIGSLVDALHVPHASELTQQLVILVDGAITVAMMGNSAESAKQAQRAAEILIAQALKT